jgi:hypothetical protein
MQYHQCAEERVSQCLAALGARTTNPSQVPVGVKRFLVGDNAAYVPVFGHKDRLRERGNAV